jgi:hypothetical protein
MIQSEARARACNACLPLLLSTAVLASIGCGTTLIGSDIERRADGWTIVLQYLRDGPNQIRPMGYTVYEPPSGARFLHAYLKVRNDSAQTRVFGYDSCDLDLGDQSVVAGLITRYNGVMSEMDKSETYPPGDVNYRSLTFTYPEGRLPTRLKCGNVTFAVPQPAAAAGH